MVPLDLLKPRHRRHDPSQRREAVKRLDDEDVLVDLASNDPDLEVRLLAVARIRSEEGLLRVAREGRHLDTRLKAARKITDPHVLAWLMRERKQPDLMMACFEGIRSQEVLREIAADPRQSVTARRIAINMFADQELLLEVLCSVREPGLRRVALERIEDPGLRQQLESEVQEQQHTVRIDRILENHDPEVVAEMLGAFRDSEAAVHALGILAARGGEAGARAAEILGRQLKHARAGIRRVALQQLRGLGTWPQDVLEAMSESDPDPTVRSEAAALVAGRREGQ